MTLTSIKKVTASALVIAVIISISVFTSFAATAQHSRDNARYTNPETGYQVLIADEDDLLTDADERLLVEDMKPLTDYGHAIFWSTNKSTFDAVDQARQFRKDSYEFDSASVLAINMASRKITIQSYGELYKFINDSKARSITDNVSHYATSKMYYNCAKEAFAQMYATASGEAIAEPMKYISYVVIALMLGVILALAIAFSKKFNPLRKAVEPPETTGSGILMTAPAAMALVRTETIIVQSSSGGGFSGGGGGFSGGGGGGGCGGGGSSSF